MQYPYYKSMSIMDSPILLDLGDDGLMKFDNKTIPITESVFEEFSQDDLLLSSLISPNYCRYLLSSQTSIDDRAHDMLLCAAITGNTPLLRLLKAKLHYDKRTMFIKLIVPLIYIIDKDGIYHEQICDLMTAINYLTGVQLGEYPNQIITKLFDCEYLINNTIKSSIPSNMIMNFFNVDQD